MKKNIKKIVTISICSLLLISTLGMQIFATYTYEQAGPSLTPNVMHTTGTYNLTSSKDKALGEDSLLWINNTHLTLNANLISSNERTLLIVMYEDDALWNASETVKTYTFEFDGRRLGDYMVFNNTPGAIEDTSGVELYLTMQLSKITGDSGSSGQFFTYQLEQY